MLPNWSAADGDDNPRWNYAPRCTVDTARRIVIARFPKRLQMESIAMYVRQLQEHPHFEGDFSEIVDLRDVEEIKLEANDFLRLADRIDPFSPNAKRAFIVRNSAQAHAARMHKILRGSARIKVCHSMDEADHWISDQI